MKIISIGKKHDAIFAGAIAHYEKRLNNIEWLILPSSGKPNEMARSAESSAILGRIRDSDYVVLLDESGETASSPDIAQFINDAQINARQLVFVIGGAYGVNNELKNRADRILSFGRAVFAHQLIRVMLLEQLYRAHSILSGSKYHHE